MFEKYFSRILGGPLPPSPTPMPQEEWGQGKGQEGGGGGGNLASAVIPKSRRLWNGSCHSRGIMTASSAAYARAMKIHRKLFYVGLG